MNLDFFSAAQKLSKERQAFVLVTLIQIKGSAPQELGAKMLVTNKGLDFGTIGGGKLEAYAIQEAQKYLQNSLKISVYEQIINLQKDIGMSCGGEVKILFEVSQLCLWKVVVFGAGHISQALIPILEKLNVHLTCVDDREDWLEKLPDTIVKFCSHPMENYVQKMKGDEFVLMLTKGHKYDQEILEQVLKKYQPPFVGVIGSKVKSKKLKQELAQRGVKKHLVEKIHCPVGFDIGDNVPIEIAISVLAQLLEYRDLYFKKKNRLCEFTEK